MSVSPHTSGQTPRMAVDWIYIRTRTIVALCVLLVVAGGIAGWWWLSEGSLPVEERAERAIASAEETLAEARIASPRAQALDVARGHLVSARQAFDENRFPGAIDEAEAAELIARELLGGSGDQDVGVRVARLDGDVRIKRAGQFMWETATERSVLAMGDQIRTGPRGSAQLIFFDGTMMTVRPGTLLEIRELYRDQNRQEHRVSERLAWGSLHASTNETPGVKGVHEVSTVSAAVRAEKGAEFSVDHDREAGRSEVVALSGDVRLQTRDEEVALPANTRVALERGAIVERSKVLEGPLLDDPPDQRTFLAPQEARITFSWFPLEGADSYQLQVSSRPMFSRREHWLEGLDETRALLPEFSPGTYYWRVAGTDGTGVRGRWSETRKLRVLGAKFQDPDDADPPPLRISEILVVGTNAIISGSTEPGALVWIAGERVDVDESGAFTWVIKLHRDGENKIAFQGQDAAGNETRRVGYAYVEAF